MIKSEVTDLANKMDDNMTYIAETQTLVGEQKRTLVDQDTGEVIHVDQVTKRAYGTKQFWKMYLMDFLTVLGIMDNKQLDIFIYICENTNQYNNMFIGTYTKIAEDVKVSRPTIAKIMKKLQENNFVKKVQNGVWLVNPNIMMKGNDTKRQILLSYYHADEPVNEITVSRTKRKEIPTKNENGIDTKSKPKPKAKPKAKSLPKAKPTAKRRTSSSVSNKGGATKTVPKKRKAVPKGSKSDN